MNERRSSRSRLDPPPAPPRYPLPPQTAEWAGRVPIEERHFGLLIDKFIHWEEPWRWDERRKRAFLSAALSAVQSARQAHPALVQRYSDLVESYRDKGFQIATFTARTRWRLLMSKARTSLLETSLTLDHLYGIPLIPATAVRGATRFYAQKVAQLDPPTTRRLFGAEEEAAGVLFFDAFPIQLPRVELDVLHTHFQEYYFGQVPPARYLSTALGFFLAVAPDTPFRFALASTDKRRLAQATRCLKGALSDLGIGAKTSVGYGYFVLESERGQARPSQTQRHRGISASHRRRQTPRTL